MHSTYLTGVELILSSTAQSGKPTECITIKDGIETYVESLKVQIEHLLKWQSATSFTDTQTGMFYISSRFYN